MPRPADDSDADDRPRRRDDADDDRPRRRRPVAQSNGPAIASLVCGVLGVTLCCGPNVPLGLAAIVLGIVGLTKVESRQSGQGMSIAGLVLGGVAILMTPVAIGLLLPAVQKVREAATTKHTANNSRQVVLGQLSHDDAFGHYAVPALSDDPELLEAGLAPKDRLSWRADLLPYVEQDALHNRLDFGKPWDAPANGPAVKTPVVQYHDAADGQFDDQTRFRMFTGPGTLADLRPKATMASVSDGTSNTILFVDSSDRVPWAQNKEIPFTPGTGAAKLGHPQRPTFYAAMADGSVRPVGKGVNPAALDAAITPNGGEVTVGPLE